MEEILNLELFTLKPEYIKVIVFIWRIIKCTLLLLITIKFFRWIINKFYCKIVSKISSNERKQQILTLKTIICHASEFIIFAIYIASMLFIFGIDIKPFLATAGVVGIAVGFGAKRFVEDIISGIIILIEGQIRVGDYVEIQGMSGTVEKITLPLITVRSDKTGAICFIRCGYIDTIINHTMNYSYAFFAFDVAYKENMDHVIETLKVCFKKLIDNQEYKKYVLQDIEIFGLDEFKESSLCVKCRIKTQPKGQWIIKRGFNNIVKEEFEKENIEIPFNQLVVKNIN